MTRLRPVTPLGILATELDALDDDLGQTNRASASAVRRLRRARNLVTGLEPYLGRCTTPESPALARLARRTREADWSAGALEAEMLSGHVEGQFLRLLVRATRASSVLEIGMFTGYSALAMAEALPDDGRLVACEIDGAVAEFAQRCFDDSPCGHKIVVHVGPATPTLERLGEAGASFDLVFVYADKQGYVGYLDLLLETGLLARTGVVCVDNTLLQGEPYVPGNASDNGSAIAAFNQRVVDDPRVEQVLLPLRDGLTLIMRADQ